MKYTVFVKRWEGHYVEIEASSVSEAERKGYDSFNSELITDSDVIVTHIMDENYRDCLSYKRIIIEK